MQKLGIWSITDQGPHRVVESEIGLESHLEQWIEADPTLLRGGLTILARQMVVEGGRIDLLALDPQGRWIIVEIKRGLLSRDTLAQAVDYASCIAAMPQDELEAKVEAYLNPKGTSLAKLLEERDAVEATRQGSRELQIIIVGTGKAPGLDRMVSFLADQYSFPITLASFDVFEIDSGPRLLAREITEPDVREVPSQVQQRGNVEDILKLAESSGIGAHFRAILDVVEKTDVYPRPFKWSVMYTPPNRRDRMLFIVSGSPAGGKLRVYVSPSAIAEFYPVAAEQVQATLGSEGWHLLDERGARGFAAAFIALAAPRSAA